jgi:hypothetical protein
MNELHPIFADLVNSFQKTPEMIHKAQVEAYIILLKRHDWTYEASDDGRSYREGLSERKELNSLQKSLDPEFVIWNQHCHDKFQNGIDKSWGGA